MKNGSLTIVGLGPARPEHITTEARMVLEKRTTRLLFSPASQH